MMAINNRAERVVAKVSGLIGGTPLVELARTSSGSRLLLKLEMFNPTGSCKVRMAREMILAAERSGALKPGGNIVEPTSGNTGTGIALMALERGYKFTAIVDQHASKDKLRAMLAMGVNLIHVKGTGGVPSTMERRRIASELAAKTGAFWPDQHTNPNNNLGYSGLADELMFDLNADIDYLVGAVGTGGTLCGTIKALRKNGSKVTSIGVEPKGSIIFGGPGGPYLQSGAGAPNGFPVGPNVDHSLIDEGVVVDDLEAFTMARVLARRTGLLVGGTSGAAISLALKRFAYVEPNSTMVVLVCDAGEKYLDTIFNDEWLQQHDLLNSSAYDSAEQLLSSFQRYAEPASTDVARPITRLAAL